MTSFCPVVPKTRERHDTFPGRVAGGTETKWVTLTARQRETETQTEAQKVRRPNVDEACSLWGRIVELYEAGTDDEREAILQAVVGRVEMDEKETGTCELAFLPQIPVSVPNRLELTNHLGAGVGLEPTTFGL